jgi:hypothetical protein
LSGITAVQAFYVISGFLITMVLNECFALRRHSHFLSDPVFAIMAVLRRNRGALLYHHFLCTFHTGHGTRLIVIRRKLGLACYSEIAYSLKDRQETFENFEAVG